LLRKNEPPGRAGSFGAVDPSTGLDG